jgi:cytochrome c oxidase cbb3-type subunit I/II
MNDPRATSPGSIMPAYPHLATETIDFESTGGKLAALRALGVPYTEDDVAHAAEDAREQATAIATGLERDVEVDPSSELVAMVAYLQRLGRERSTFVPARRAAPEGEAISRAEGVR